MCPCVSPCVPVCPRVSLYVPHQVRTLTADLSRAKYLCKMHLVAGTMPFDSLKKTDNFYTLTGKSAETDTSEGVRDTTDVQISGPLRTL